MISRMREHAIPENFVQALAEWPPFAALALPDQLQAARMIWEDGSKARAHHAVPGATSYSYKDLAERFGRKRFNTINQTARMFDVGRSWSVRRGETRPFGLTSVYRQIKAQHLRSVVEERPVSRFVDMQGRRVQSRLAAISSKRRNGATTTLWAGVTIRPTIPVNTDNLAQLYHLCSDRLRLKSASLPAALGTRGHDAALGKLIRTNEAAAILLALAHIEGRETGSIPVYYTESTSGRLYASGHNLQNCPRVVRYAALDGAWDIDLDNAHFTLLVELAERTGFTCSAVRHYLQNKVAVRQELASRLSSDIDSIKACLLALIYDAPRSSSRFAAFGRYLGKNKADHLLSLPLFQALAKEVRRAGQHVLATWPSRNSSLVNSSGCGIPLAAPRKQRLAHLLQGAEALVLKTAVVYLEGQYPGNVQLLQHDGLTVRQPINLDALNAHVQEVTALKVTFEAEQIQWSISESANASFFF
jgi:hypothetical protein